MQFFIKCGLNVKFLPLSRKSQKYQLETLRQMGVEVLFSEYSTTYWRDWLKQNGYYIDYIYLNQANASDAYLAGLRCYTSAKIIFQGQALDHLKSCVSA
jgi:hypothetical protein